jgi:hypothetical protein
MGASSSVHIRGHRVLSGLSTIALASLMALIAAAISIASGLLTLLDSSATGMSGTLDVVRSLF